jgi:excisionase family DNA binding protein
VPDAVRTIEEVARYLGGIHHQTVRKLIRTGELGHVRVGRRIFVTDDQLAEYIDTHTISPAV